MVGQTISRYKITENWASSKQIVGVRHLFGVVSFSEGERNAVSLVRSDALLPKPLRHDAEHRAAIHAVEPGLERMDADSPDLRGPH